MLPGPNVVTDDEIRGECPRELDSLRGARADRGACREHQAERVDDVARVRDVLDAPAREGRCRRHAPQGVRHEEHPRCGLVHPAPHHRRAHPRYASCALA